MRSVRRWWDDVPRVGARRGFEPALTASLAFVAYLVMLAMRALHAAVALRERGA